MNTKMDFRKDIKKMILFTALVGMVLGCLHTQSIAQGFYFRGGLGYAIPQAGQTMDGTGVPYSGTTNNTMSVDSVNYTSYNLKKISFASGLHGTIAGGYMITNNIGIDLAISYGLSSTSYTYTDENETVGGVPCNVQVIQKAITPVMLMPALVLQTGGDVVNIYARTGIALPLKTMIQQDQIITNLPGTGTIETDDYTWQIKSSFSLGLTAAAGAQYKISDKFKLWCEASFLSLSVFAKEANMTNVTVDGQGGYLTQVPVDERKIVYSNNFNSTSNDYYHQPTYSQPFSMVAFNVGFIYLFPHEVRYKSKVKPPKEMDRINNVF